MGKNDIQPERILTIRSFGREKAMKIAAWKYWEIVDELINRGVSRKQAHDAAEWASKTRSKGQYTDILTMVLIIE